MNKRKICIIAFIMIAIIALLNVSVFANESDIAYGDSVLKDISERFGDAETDLSKVTNNVKMSYFSYYDYVSTVEDGQWDAGKIYFQTDLSFENSVYNVCVVNLKNDDNGETIQMPLRSDDDGLYYTLYDLEDYDYNGSFYISDLFVYAENLEYHEAEHYSDVLERYIVHYQKEVSEENAIQLEGDLDFHIYKTTIDKFSIVNNELNKDNSMKIDLAVSIPELQFVYYDIKNVLTNKEYYIESDGASQFFNINNLTIQNVPDGEYEIQSIKICGRLVEPSGFGKLKMYIWTNDPDKYGFNRSGDAIRVRGNIPTGMRFTINREDEQIKENLESISLDKTTAKLNDSVFVDMLTNNPVKEATLIFNKNDDSESMIVTLTDTNEKPYFKVPFTTSAGTYNLSYLILKDYNGEETQYRSDEEYLSIKHFDFNCTLTIEEEFADTDILHLENEKIVDSIVEKLKELDDNVVIEIVADQDTTIRSDIFEAIQGTNKTLRIKYNNVEWLFNGKDIKEIKSIDVRVWVYGIYNDELYGWAIKSGLGLDFANNGKLPGKCLIRVKNDTIVEQYLNGKISYVYFYESGGYDFDKVAMQVNCVNNEYYEFYISHNSTYIMTTEEIDEQYVTDNTEDLVLNGGTATTSNNSGTKISSSTSAQGKVSSSSAIDTSDTIIIMKYALAILCVFLLILIVSGKILSNKKKNKE